MYVDLFMSIHRIYAPIQFIVPSWLNRNVKKIIQLSTALKEINASSLRKTNAIRIILLKTSIEFIEIGHVPPSIPAYNYQVILARIFTRLFINFRDSVHVAALAKN